jgi:hypothetical protein
MRHDKTPFFLDFIGGFFTVGIICLKLKKYICKIKKISIVFSDVKIEF